MWTIPSAGRWIFLLSLMLVLIFSTTGVKSVDIPCCPNGTKIKISEHYFWKHFEACYEQNPRPGCAHHAFVLKPKKEGKKNACISPEATWLLNMIEKGKLKCTPI